MFFFRKVGTVSNQRVLCYIILRSVYLRKVQPHNFTCIVLRNECLGFFFFVDMECIFPPTVLFIIRLVLYSPFISLHLLFLHEIFLRKC